MEQNAQEHSSRNNIREQLGQSVRGFHLPRYQEIMDVGLYLEQVTKYISDTLAPLSSSVSITSSMISNYVKRGLIANPVKKQYNREQIAYLFYIALVKSVLSMEDIRLTISLQKEQYESQRAYDYFCCEFENILEYIFGAKDAPDIVGVDNSDVKNMLRTTIITVAHKIYLDKFFALFHESDVQAEK